METRTAETILQEGQSVKIGDKTYTIAPPTIGTLIRVSEILGRVPELDIDENVSPEERAIQTLRKAQNFGVIPELYATLILGNKRINETEKVRRNGRKWGKKEERKMVDILADQIRDEVSPTELQKTIPFLLSTLQLTDFFVLITFLNEISLTKPTKVIKTTVSGQ